MLFTMTLPHCIAYKAGDDTMLSCMPYSAVQEDTDVPVMALVDLYGSQPVSSAAAAASSLSSQYPGAKLRMAGLFHVHKGLYDERPGLKLLQVWTDGWASL